MAKKKHTPSAGHSPSLRESFKHLGLRDWNSRRKLPKFLSWPPDVFAFAAWMLRESGAYTKVALHEDPAINLSPSWRPRSEWRAEVRRCGRSWGTNVTAQPPQAVVDAFFLLQHAATATSPAATLSDIATSGIWVALHNLLAIADEACWELGLVTSSTGAIAAKLEDGNKRTAAKGRNAAQPATLATEALSLLAKHLEDQSHEREEPFSSTLCKFVRRDRAIVLPKIHTPQAGLTIRSLSHHLALYTGSEVEALWCPSYPPSVALPSLAKPQPETFNLLVVPHPFTVAAAQFGAVEFPDDPDAKYFSFNHRRGKLTRSALGRLIAEAADRVGRISGLILPEAAISNSESKSLLGASTGTLPGGLDFLVCGVTTKPSARKGVWGKNQALVRMNDGENVREYRQDKHHRWRLTGDQLRMYHITSPLHPEHNWWESIQLPLRKLAFFELGRTCVITVLICEDLARPDPAGDLIRAVGPDLVVALLQDGPQLSNRWPSRFAGVLSDDPGSSVLTVTSLGMCERSRPLQSLASPPSRVIAMWRDPIRGHCEIALPPGHHAAVLTIVKQTSTELSADGRNDGESSTTLTLGSVETLTIPELSGL